MLLRLSREFFRRCIFFNSIISLHFFFIVSVSLLRFPISSITMCIFSFMSLSMFTTMVLKCLSAHSDSPQGLFILIAFFKPVGPNCLLLHMYSNIRLHTTHRRLFILGFRLSSLREH